jgi:DNA invertase Pin-like site-specific DNA recombinase
MRSAKSKGTRSGKPIGRPRRVFNRGEVVRLRQDGVSLAKIALQMNIGVATVARVLQSPSA